MLDDPTWTIVKIIIMILSCSFQSSAILAGLSLAAIGFGGRYLLRRAPDMSKKISEAMKTFPTAESFATSKYYRGGFEAKMNRREASLILGVSPTAPKTKVIDIFFTINDDG